MRITGLRSAENYAGQRKKHSLWKRIVAALACIVVFVTTYMLILPAITAENQTYCGKDHEHTLQCFSDPNADVESQETWEKDIQNISLTGKPAEDVVAVAKSQIGYEESQKNYNVTEDGQQKGYTRYGAWYGDCYGDWDAMFVAFCLNYAGVQDYPADADCKIWMEQVSAEPYNDFHDTDAYQPQAGNLIFFDTDEDGEADHMGVVVSTDVENAKVQTIEGDVSDRVQYSTYASDDATILGYASIPDNAEEDSSAVAVQGKGNGNSGGQSDDIQVDVKPDDSAYSNRYTKLNDGYSTANQWQITDQLYSDVKSGEGNYTYSQDGSVRIQKAVIPSGTENKFQIYLNAEPQISWEEFFDSCGQYATHNNSDTFNPSSGVSKLYSEAEYATMSESDKKNMKPIHINCKLTSSLTISQIRYIDFSKISKVNNGSYCIENKKFAWFADARKFSRNVPWSDLADGKKESLDVDCTEAYSKVTFAENSAQPSKVTDLMGKDILFDKVMSYDGGSYSVPSESNGNMLTWNLPKVSYENRDYVVVKTKDGKETAYYSDVYQMRYSISLNVNANDFHSCAPLNASPAESIYPTNGTTTLVYQFDSDSRTVDFPIPEVRGLLYDISFDKKSDSGKSLAGATFTLSGADDNLRTITTVENETSQFTDLPCGTYDLQETSPPKGYTAPEDNAWTIDLNYTNNRNVLAQNSLNPTNMRYIGNDQNGQWVIVNTKNPYTYQINILKTDDTGETVLQNASFSIVDPEDMAKTLTGATDENGSLSFDAAFKPNIEYVLTETSAPDGYNLLPAAIHFKVTEPDDEDSGTEERTVELTNSDELNNLVQLTLSEQEDGKGLLTIQVKNQEGYELPETGGHGTISFTLCGLAFITGALMYKYHQVHHKKKRRAE